MAVLAKNRFGVKLHSLYCEFFMSHAHYFATFTILILGPCRHLQAIGKLLCINHQ